MNILLIFFAIPLATIILSAILETFINCPFKVAGIFFSIFIVIAFALGGTAELIVAAIIYTIISFITALIVRLIINRQCNRCNDWNNNTCNNCNNLDNNINTLSFNNGVSNGNNNNLLGLNNGDATVVTAQEDVATLNLNNTVNNNRCRRCR